MPKRLLALISKDARLITRNWFLFITLFVAVLCIVLVNFVIPEDVSLEPTVYVLDESNGKSLNAIAADLSSRDNSQIVKSRDELEKSMLESANSIGMILIGTLEKPNVEFVLHGFENDKTKEILALEMDAYFGKLDIETEIEKAYTGDIERRINVPFNHSMLPLFLLMEPVMLGLFFIATLMFFEKAEGTTKAYAVSPGTMMEYLMSKVIVMFLLGLGSMYLVTLATVGFKANLGLMLAIAFAGSFFGSSLGLLISSFFDNLSKAMIWIIFVSILLSAPFAAYYMPSFSPVWIRVMPTYSLLFALKETIYQTGQTNIVLYSIMLSAPLGVLLFGGAFYRYQKNLV